MYLEKTMSETKKETLRARGAVLQPVIAGLFSALIALCSWVQVPFDVPFTLQTFAVFSALLFLGGKYGTLSIAAYVLLGAVGAPVFAGFVGGVGVLLGATGGYITGFLAGGLVYWGIEALFRKKTGRLSVRIAGLAACLAVCYLFGTVWFTAVHENMVTAAGILSSLSLCVVPFLLPDAVKLALAVLLWKRLSPRLNAV